MGMQFENDYFTEMCGGSEAGSHLRLTDFVYYSTLGCRVIKKKKIGDAGVTLVQGYLAHKKMPPPRTLP